jgi:hypothetical protein
MFEIQDEVMNLAMCDIIYIYTYIHICIYIYIYIYGHTFGIWLWTSVCLCIRVYVTHGVRCVQFLLATDLVMSAATHTHSATLLCTRVCVHVYVLYCVHKDISACMRARPPECE